ncbi:hypothetical protein IX321_002456 [Bacteroides pyogenes]|nr:hypothetical protein [Bacteroides pyogenes]MBR8747992.1 hypothetical protein [Bacteroides pyogenes]MBR8758283.1 hypothetical protein [Bacteroides pyogenes]MBR8781494.1 hypothetical protein [Bacteroides pyogenes]
MKKNILTLFWIYKIIDSVYLLLKYKIKILFLLVRTMMILT